MDKQDCRSSDWLFSAHRPAQRFHLLTPRSKQTEGSFLVESERLRGHCFGNPIGKLDVLGNMSAGGGVYLMNPCKVSDWESLRDSHQRRPQSSMHISYFAADEPTHQDIWTIPDRAGHSKDLSTLRVRPPATANRSAGDSFDE
jgi:hypothetical protein